MSQTNYNTQTVLEQAIECEPLIINGNTLAIDAIAAMSKARISYILIVEQEELVGILTERDIVKLTAKEIPLENVYISEVMTRDLITLSIAEASDIFCVLAQFRNSQIRHLPIFNEQKHLLGVITGESLRKAIKPTDLLQMGRVGQIMTTTVITASTTASVFEVAQEMATHQKSCVVICFPSEYLTTSNHKKLLKPVGIITERDIVKFTASGINIGRITAQQVMSAPLLPVQINTTLWQAHQIMEQHKIRRLVVIDEAGYLAGIITQTNLLHALDPVEMYATVEILQQTIAEQTYELRKVNEQMQMEVDVRKDTEEKLRRAKEVADRANRTKTEFLSNMTHELRTPLNAILGFTQLLSRDPSLKNKQQEYLEIISRSGEHLLNLINNILQMSKIEQGRITINENSFDLYYMLDTLEEMFQVQAKKKGIQLIFDYSNELFRYVETDESKLRQILINLLGNAIKFTSDGGVTLRIKSESTANQYRLLFEVEDTGPGIDREEIENLFKDFSQTEIGEQSQEGTGLGLFISKKLVEVMGGKILVRSILGKGSIFKFDIQISLPDMAKIQNKQPHCRVIGLAKGQSQYRILVVDDRQESRLWIGKLLSSIGFAVREAENGQEAINLWNSWQPQLILMDMRMPILDGYEATKHIKANLNGNSTVVIALTASAFEEDKAEVLSVGCDDFIAKPCREQVVLDKISQYLGVRYIWEELTSSNSTKQPSFASSEMGENKKNGKSASSFILNSSSFEVMPSEWLDELYEAATSVDNESIFQLLAQVPDNHGNFANAIADLAKNFRCDKIMDLIDEFRGS